MPRRPHSRRSPSSPAPRSGSRGGSDPCRHGRQRGLRSPSPGSGRLAATMEGDTHHRPRVLRSGPWESEPELDRVLGPFRGRTRLGSARSRRDEACQTRVSGTHGAAVSTGLLPGIRRVSVARCRSMGAAESGSRRVHQGRFQQGPRRRRPESPRLRPPNRLCPAAGVPSRVVLRPRRRSAPCRRALLQPRRLRPQRFRSALDGVGEVFSGRARANRGPAGQ